MVSTDLIRQGMERAVAGLSPSSTVKTPFDIPVPQTDDELWELVRRLWGMELPRYHRPCPEHEECVSPFRAFADAFFARHSMVVWHGSRGFSGKTVNLALLALTEAVVLSAKVNLLGGSLEQSTRALKYMYGKEIDNTFWEAPGAPIEMIRGGKDALTRETTLTNNAWIRALAASRKSVRGPHPERLRLDEVDEMELQIFDDATGQTMSVRGIPAQTVASSTWHNADGTMTEVFKRAARKGWKVYRWCWRMCLEPEGWLPKSEIERKKHETTQRVFEVEYDLLQPNPESRVINTEKLKAAFRKDLGEFNGDPNEVIRIDVSPKKYNLFLGADWGKRSHWSVFVTLEAPDGDDPLRMVGFERRRRQSWPFIISKYDGTYQEFLDSERLDNKKRPRWKVYAAHDMTGVGDVIDDYMETDAEGVWLAGKIRYEILSDYISAIEHGEIEFPWVEWMYKEHEQASEDDVFGTGKKNHCPDSIMGGALAWYAYKNRRKRKARATWGN